MTPTKINRSLTTTNSLLINDSFKNTETDSLILWELNQRPIDPLYSQQDLKEKTFTVIKKEAEDSSVEIKIEPNWEPLKRNKLIPLAEMKKRLSLINPKFDYDKEIGIENCLPCNISHHNWILSGSEYPEEVEHFATPFYEHMTSYEDGIGFLKDPHLEKLNNPKEIHEWNERGELKEYICLTDDLPLTFVSVPLINLKNKIEKDVAWQQYQKSGETFKIGILFLPYRNDESKAHLLSFQYRKVSKFAYNLYITDPQSSQCFTFEEFLRTYKKHYADDIKMWSGQNKINYDCNKTVKEMFDSLKAEENQNLELPPEKEPDVSPINTKIKIKIPQKRSGEMQPEPIVSKRLKPNIELEPAVVNHSPGHSKHNSWARIAELCLLKPQNTMEDESLDIIPEITKIPSRMPFGYESNHIEKSENSESFEDDEIEKIGSDNCEETGIDSDFNQAHKEFVSITDSNKNANYLEFENEMLFFSRSCSELEALGDLNYHHQNYEKALNYYSLASKKGSSSAQAMLGFMYYNGIGVAHNYEVSFENYKRAADSPPGNLTAQAAVGFMYYYGIGVQQNFVSALKYCQLGAISGDINSQVILGNMHFYGQEIPINQVQAFNLFKLAADRGNVEAQHQLGRMYENGFGVEIDYRKALKYYKDAAKQGHVASQAIIGHFYYFGQQGFGQKYEGSVLKLFNHSVDINLKEAFKYYKLAADQGHTDSQKMLASMYEKGIGVEINLGEANRYYKLAGVQESNPFNESS